MTLLFPKDPRIRFGGFHQLVVRANGGNPAFPKNDDQICPADLRKAVRDDERCPSARRVGNGALDLVLGG